ncbi:CU044_2847 family protein [Streptomyces sp. NPDC059853]|uniref:CU044_2847 family protein n=1 Tax=Streptomyces sp. NPDC059853 TaxID=3346973 RepID=UPI003656B78E
MSKGITEISLPDGTPVLARVSGIEELHRPTAPGGYVDTGIADAAVARLDSLRGLIGGVAASLAEGLRGVRPDEVSVTFGVELTARAGRIVGLLADGETKGSLTVTLTWQGSPPAAPDPAPAPPGQRQGEAA